MFTILGGGFGGDVRAATSERIWGRDDGVGFRFWENKILFGVEWILHGDQSAPDTVRGFTCEEIPNNLRELRHNINRDLDALNHEVDDVRAEQLGLSNMVADLKKHLCSLQASYASIILGKNKCNKVKWVVRVLSHEFLK
ncbi:unnamed protein product [Lactuca saligna]|uniref:Uncharacterized protein n=1 Tax=Lactuca saligna TaxID=75948 RepID=A0AA36ELJ9_LACSI|nr:unnamed protein product [Lactuca saligna]